MHSSSIAVFCVFILIFFSLFRSDALQMSDPSFLSSFLRTTLPLIGVNSTIVRHVHLIGSPNIRSINSLQCLVNATVQLETACVPLLLPGSGNLASALSSAYSLGTLLSVNGVSGTALPGTRKLLQNSGQVQGSVAAAISPTGCGCGSLLLSLSSVSTTTAALLPVCTQRF